jgi:UDP-glucose 4-epimerase
VVKSTTAVYGTSPRDPAVFTEDMPAKAIPRSGYAKDAVEVEGYVRGFARRRPDIATTVLRFANFVGPQVGTTLTRYFALPVVPTVLGYDPRLQVLHEADAVEVLRRATLLELAGVYNVAGDGVLLLSQAIRRAGLVGVSVPRPAVSFVSRLIRSRGLVDFSPDQMEFLYFGRVVDTTRLKTKFGYQPVFSTAQAFDSFLAGAGIAPVITRDAVGRVEATFADGSRALVDAAAALARRRGGRETVDA